MIEILDTYKHNELCFALIAKCFGNERHIYQFGISQAGYNTIKRIFQYRPFNNLSNSKYRYYWHYGCGNDQYFYSDIQFEQDNNSKSYKIKADKLFGSNLKWFLEKDNPEEIKEFIVKKHNE